MNIRSKQVNFIITWAWFCCLISSPCLALTLTSTEVAKLIANDGMVADRFGFSVAVHGDTAVIGADLDDDNGPSSGSAYVFVRSGTSWNEQAKLTASDGAADEEFGFSVSLDGDTAVIAAVRDDDNGSFSGSAYVFVRNGSSWSEQTKLTASDGTAYDLFGISVALDNDTAVIGAERDNKTSSVYVFVRSGSSWSEQTKLTASHAENSDWFGRSVAVEDNIAIIGAFGDNDNGGESGSVYVFVRSGSSWSEQDKLTPSDGMAWEFFGFSTALDSNIVLIGAPNVGTAPGSAYVFSLDLDDEGPITRNVVLNPSPVLINSSIILSTTVDDSTTGNSNILSAEYSVDGAIGITMWAQDGAFDQVIEDVSATIIPFPEPGVHDVCVLGMDSAGNIGDEQCVLLAAYDPDAGFVTGGGWIHSPAGAYAENPGLSGKANFGFVVKYQKNKSDPRGNTEFRFQAGKLNFQSKSHQWLVIDEAKAQYKGIGTINGAGHYGLMLSAVDAAWTQSTDVDLLRIKIWDIDAGGVVVYDSENGASDSADPTTPIGSGSITPYKA